MFANTKWADAMRDALGASTSEGAPPQRAFAKVDASDGSEENEPGQGIPLPRMPDPGPPIPTAKAAGSKRKGPVLPPPPERPPRAASELTAHGHDRRLNPWRPQEPLTADEAPPPTSAGATIREPNALNQRHPPAARTEKGRGGQSAPATPRGRDEAWDHFDLHGDGFSQEATFESRSIPPSPRNSDMGGSTVTGFALTCRTWDPSATWWGAHPAETARNLEGLDEATDAGLPDPEAENQEPDFQEGDAHEDGHQFAPSSTADQPEEEDHLHHEDVEEMPEPSPPEEEQEEDSGRGQADRQAAKVDAMASLQVEISPKLRLGPMPSEPLPTAAPFAGGAWPSEPAKTIISSGFGTYELSTKFLHAKGGGGWGPKYIALDCQLSRRVVLWRFLPPKDLEFGHRSQARDDVAAEVVRLRRIRNPRLCPYLTSEIINGDLHVIIGYAPGGSVADWLADAGPLGEAPSRRVARAVLEGLVHLHNIQEAHGALRGGNVLLGPGSAIRLSDFGLHSLRAMTRSSASNEAERSESSPGRSILDSPAPWLAPEILEERIATSIPGDVWALGCLVVEMALAKPPALGTAYRASQAQQAGHGLPPLLPEEINGLHGPSQFFVGRCMRLDPNSRPSSKQLLAGISEAEDSQQSDDAARPWTKQ